MATCSLSAHCSVLALYAPTNCSRGIKGEMPSFARKLGPAEISDLTAYLRSLE